MEIEGIRSRRPKHDTLVERYIKLKPFEIQQASRERPSGSFPYLTTGGDISEVRPPEAPPQARPTPRRENEIYSQPFPRRGLWPRRKTEECTCTFIDKRYHKFYLLFILLKTTYFLGESCVSPEVAPSPGNT